MIAVILSICIGMLLLPFLSLCFGFMIELMFSSYQDFVSGGAIIGAILGFLVTVLILNVFIAGSMESKGSENRPQLRGFVVQGGRIGLDYGMTPSLFRSLVACIIALFLSGAIYVSLLYPSFIKRDPLDRLAGGFFMLQEVSGRYWGDCPSDFLTMQGQCGLRSGSAVGRATGPTKARPTERDTR